MLTRKQRDLLLFIHDRMAQGDIAPSFDEMKEALGLKSKSGIHRLITGLVERGYLQRMPNRARALEVKKLPEGSTPANTDKSRVAAISRNVSAVLADVRLMQIPLYGKIAAGTPIEAIRDEGQMLDFPASMLGSGDHYALKVQGDSMINAGINDRDIVIIKKGHTADNGRIVVALVEGEEVTLKRLRRAGGKIVLEPENDAYEPRVLDPSQVEIQGELVSLIRNYH